MDEDQIVEIGNMAAADEAILVKIITFGQRGVPPKKKPLEKDEEENEYDDNLLEWIIKESVSAVINKKLEDFVKAIDYVPHTLPPSSGLGLLVILEDNEPVIKI